MKQKAEKQGRGGRASSKSVDAASLRKSITIDISDVICVEEMYADDAKQVVKATLEMSIFTLNVDATGYGDSQMAVEECCRVGEEGSKDKAKLMTRGTSFSP